MILREKAETRLGLKAGEWVTVRSKYEILATLDARARLDGMPFQPEMFAHCGKRYRVGKVAHKTCDTVLNTGSRSVPHAVHLEGVRCDGSAHNGCQARCLMFWKEAWLQRAKAPGEAKAGSIDAVRFDSGADRDRTADLRLAGALKPMGFQHRGLFAKPAPNPDRAAAPVPAGIPGVFLCSEDRVRSAVVAPGSKPSDADPVWVCQTTALPEMSHPMKWWHPRQYVLDVLTGNHGAWKVMRMISFGGFRLMLRFGMGRRFLLACYNAFQNLRGAKPYPHADGVIPLGKPTPHEALDLKVGEKVVVKSPEEIMATLSVQGRNRGMWFDQEMVKYCGNAYAVELRVERLIDERTGKMLVMKNPCIQLQGVICKGECTADRLGCPRGINSYWREIWLRRV
jgi:hypothetical protein